MVELEGQMQVSLEISREQREEMRAVEGEINECHRNISEIEAEIHAIGLHLKETEHLKEHLYLPQIFYSFQ